MNERTPRFLSRLRIFVPLAVLVLILAGATTAFASGAFESNDSGFDSARDIAERGSVAASTTTTSLQDANDSNDDHGVDLEIEQPAPTAESEVVICRSEFNAAVEKPNPSIGACATYEAVVRRPTRIRTRPVGCVVGYA